MADIIAPAIWVDDVHVQVKCPHCPEYHTHGSCLGTHWEGHRTPHCKTKYRAQGELPEYYVKETANTEDRRTIKGLKSNPDDEFIKCSNCGAIYPKDYVGTEHDHICDDIDFDFNSMTKDEAIFLVEDNKQDIKKYAWKSKKAEDSYYGENGDVWKHWARSQNPQLVKKQELISTIKEELSMEEVLEYYNIPYTRRNHYFLISCPNPEHPDNNPSCVVWNEIGVFKCYSCGSKGDVIEFLRLLELNKK